MELKREMLVVDDDEAFRDLLRQYFELKGWKVHAVDNADDGIRVFRRHHPSCVLSDINLGEGLRDGFSFCEQVRDDVSSAHTAVILMSADRRGHQDQLHGRSLGADAYLIKPFKMATLEERVTDVLRARAAEK
jgi:DNA-binding response OmpR family regulator